jgi:hypothetical protein
VMHRISRLPDDLDQLRSYPSCRRPAPGSCRFRIDARAGDDSIPRPVDEMTRYTERPDS